MDTRAVKNAEWVQWRVAGVSIIFLFLSLLFRCKLNSQTSPSSPTPYLSPFWSGSRTCADSPPQSGSQTSLSSSPWSRDQEIVRHDYWLSASTSNKKTMLQQPLLPLKPLLLQYSWFFTLLPSFHPSSFFTLSFPMLCYACFFTSHEWPYLLGIIFCEEVGAVSMKG